MLDGGSRVQAAAIWAMGGTGVSFVMVLLSPGFWSVAATAVSGASAALAWLASRFDARSRDRAAADVGRIVDAIVERLDARRKADEAAGRKELVEQFTRAGFSAVGLDAAARRPATVEETIAEMESKYKGTPGRPAPKLRIVDEASDFDPKIWNEIESKPHLFKHVGHVVKGPVYPVPPGFDGAEGRP